MNAMTDHLSEEGADAPFYLPQSDEVAVFQAAARADMDAALKLIADARDNIEACIRELGRILS